MSFILWFFKTVKLAYGVGVSVWGVWRHPLLYADFTDFEGGVAIPPKWGLTSRVKGGQA
jgi:hypothetical protein